MQIDETGVARRLRVSVGHADHRSLLQAEHVIDVLGPVAQERQFGRAGIAEYFANAEGTQQLERCLFDGEGFNRDAGFLGRCHMISSSIKYSVTARSKATKQSSLFLRRYFWIASLRSQ